MAKWLGFSLSQVTRVIIFDKTKEFYLLEVELISFSAHSEADALGQAAFNPQLLESLSPSPIIT